MSQQKGYKKIAINMPDEVFEKIKRRAKNDDVPFTVKAVELLKCGLFDYEESEEHELEGAINGPISQ